jgi:rRNA biogenesis protein RRP5
LADLRWWEKVFAVAPEKNRVILTLKKSLLNSALPILSPTDAKVGLDVDGLVTQIMDKGMLVELFGGIRAFVPIGEAT